jgi:hypothetical protein
VDINRYAYASNDPVNASDPNGHSTGVGAAMAEAAKTCTDRKTCEGLAGQRKEFEEGGAQGAGQEILDNANRLLLGSTNPPLGVMVELGLAPGPLPSDYFGPPVSPQQAQGRIAGALAINAPGLLKSGVALGTTLLKNAVKSAVKGADIYY